MKVFISAVERSADLHAFHLIVALRRLNPKVQVEGILGDLNPDEKKIFNTNDLGVMGFWDVIPKIPRALSMVSKTCDYLISQPVDALIVIDGPDFQFRLLKKLRAKGYKGKIFYWGIPQVWIWKKYRIGWLKSLCDYSIPFLPFERDLLNSHGVSTRYFGHPILEEMDLSRGDRRDFCARFNIDLKWLDRPWVGVFPGSRRAELQNHRAVLKSVMREIRDSLILIAATKPGLGFNAENIVECVGIGEELFRYVDRALVKSGTSSLQASLHGISFLVFFRTAKINEWIIKYLIGYNGPVSLPNIILGRNAIKEVIQEDFRVDVLLKEFNCLPKDFKLISSEIIERLGSGSAVSGMAKFVYETI